MHIGRRLAVCAGFVLLCSTSTSHFPSLSPAPHNVRPLGFQSKYRKKSIEVADNNKRKKCLQTRVQKCGYVSHCASLVRPAIVSDAEYDDGRARAGDDEKGVRIEIEVGRAAVRWFADLHQPPPPLGWRGRIVVSPALTDNASPRWYGTDANRAWRFASRELSRRQNAASAEDAMDGSAEFLATATAEVSMSSLHALRQQPS